MGKAKRQEMSGIFDFFKKKKESEQKSLFDVFAPGSGAMIPAPSSGLPAAPKEEKKSIFAFLDPKSKPPAQLPAQLPAQVEPKKKGLSIFDVLKPKAVIPVQEPPPPAPSQPMAAWAEMFPVQAEPEPPPSAMFEKIMRTEEPPPKYVFIAPSSPPELKPKRPYSLPAPSTAPVVEWTIPDARQLAEHFRQTMDLPAMWNMIREVRAHPEFRNDMLAHYWKGIPMIVPVDPIVFREKYTDFANFYGIPWGVIQMYLDVPEAYYRMGEEAVWKNVLSPLNATLPDAFEILKPDDLPGFFSASFKEPTGEYWLNYIEPMLESPEDPGGTGAA